MRAPKNLLLVAIVLVAAAWTPASARPHGARGGRPGVIGTLVRLVKNPTQTMRQLGRNRMARTIRDWRAQGLQVLKVGEGAYLTFRRQRPTKIPGNNPKGWLSAVGPGGALAAYHRGLDVKLRSVENATWKLRAAIAVRPDGKVDYDIPSSIRLGYDPSNAYLDRGHRGVYYHADLGFAGTPSARQRVTTNMSLRDLGGDIQRQKKTRYTGLELTLPRDRVHSGLQPDRVTLSAKLLNRNTLIATTGHISGNQRTDQIAVYERQPAR